MAEKDLLYTYGKAFVTAPSVSRYNVYSRYLSCVCNFCFFRLSGINFSMQIIRTMTFIIIISDSIIIINIAMYQWGCFYLSLTWLIITKRCFPILIP